MMILFNERSMISKTALLQAKGIQLLLIGSQEAQFKTDSVAEHLTPYISNIASEWA